jgi:flagellar biosynthesis protein FlhB
MTKQEVKDERKAQEGDETTKRKIIAKGLQRIQQRIMFSVPRADVVITNPTHFAVALRYDRGKDAAPTVVAKGQDYLALKIREIARASGVPIVERKALARALYASTEVGKEIPRELFRAVAEVLAYVYRLKGPNWSSRHQAQR